MMRYRRLCLIAVLLLIFAAQRPTAILAQEAVDPVVQPLRQRVEDFLERLAEGSSIKVAYDTLLKPGPLASREEIESLVEETGKIEQLYGTYVGFEPVYTKRVGNDLVFLKYLYRCSSFPVLWHVTFYRTSSNGELRAEASRTWQVVAIRFDTDLELLTLLKE